MDKVLKASTQTASLILAAGRGSRMKGFEGNKTLLPLLPGKSPFQGSRPILIHVLESLPPGPKAIVIHHRKEDVIKATRAFEVEYFEQGVLNGTGGALLAARSFLEKKVQDKLIITMGDIPFVRRSTYCSLLEKLGARPLVVLGFKPQEKKQYGVVETEGEKVTRIIEWKYWSTYPRERQAQLRVCNSGIYAARRKELMRYLPLLAQKSHKVLKENDGRTLHIEEFFITDLVELMARDGLHVGCVIAEDEDEVMGVDDFQSLIKAQEIFARIER